jgi:lipopolysaccharide/colanic/teichoic acid biosynthesis glycosyltransferase
MTDRHADRAERLLILGTTPLATQLVRELERRRDRRKRRLLGLLSDGPPDDAVSALCLGPISMLESVVEQRRPQRIIVALAERRGSTPISALLDCFVQRGIMVEDAAVFYERLTGKLAIESLTPMSLVSSRLFPTPAQESFARAASLIAGLAALILFSPLFLLFAIAIKLDSPGPVLFRQVRVGARGRPFTLLKYRTMHIGDGTSEWEADNRHRVTRVGKLLRRFRLDELPQFINILRGEMNLVGPRPHPASNLELFTLVGRNLNDLTGVAIGCYALRLLVRPGMTGWAQVRYRYANNLDEEIEKLRYDLYYIKHRSPWLDLRILAATLKVVVFRPRPAGHPADQAVAAPRNAPAGRVSPDASRLTT